MPRQRKPIVARRPRQFWLGPDDSDISAHLDKLPGNISEYIRALIRADIKENPTKAAIEKMRAALIVIETEELSKP